jgi:hypothetical protein
MERGNQGHCPRHQKAMSKLLSVCPVTVSQVQYTWF